jgi:hypothetical protein
MIRCPDLTSFANQGRSCTHPITFDCEVNFLDAIHGPTQVLISGVARYSGCASADLAMHACNGRVEACMEEGYWKLIRFKSSWLCGEVNWSFPEAMHKTLSCCCFFLWACCSVCCGCFRAYRVFKDCPVLCLVHARLSILAACLFPSHDLRFQL